VKWVLAYLFDCSSAPHVATSAPAGFAYVCCLDCGREIPYSLGLMRIVTKKEQLQYRSTAARPRSTLQHD
jgi:hypothetical protein